MQLSPINIILLLSYAVFMAVGQIAFKYVSQDLGRSASIIDAVTTLPFNIWFWITGVLYGATMIYWIWILTRVSLSIAYPFASLSLLILPVLSYFFHNEPLSVKYLVGAVLVIAGVSVVVS